MITRILDRGIEIEYSVVEHQGVSNPSQSAGLDALASRVTRTVLCTIGLGVAAMVCRTAYESSPTQLIAQLGDAWHATERH